MSLLDRLAKVCLALPEASAYIGPRGWTGLRLDRGKVDWHEVGTFVRSSYSMVAPKTLSRLG